MTARKKIALISVGLFLEVAILGVAIFALRYSRPLSVWPDKIDISPDGSLVINLNQPMLNWRLGNNISIEPPIKGQIIVDDFRRRIVFKPQDYLLAGQTYKVKLRNLWSLNLIKKSQAEFIFYGQPSSVLATIKPAQLPKVHAANVALGCDAQGPPTMVGKIIDVDLVKKNIWLYDNGECVAKYEVHRYGGPSTPTPKGQFKVRTKEPNHFSSSALVWMPWSMNFNGDVFLHGIPYFPNGAILRGSYSHGCIQIPTDQAEKIYNFAQIGTPVFVR